MAKTVNGRERSWQLMEGIGSGDAGEVLRVVSQSGDIQGVMKRPLQNVSGGTIVRQATQIETEGKILDALEGVNFSKNGLTIHTPLLLDQSIPGTSKTSGLFMVSEEIKGVSITSMLAQHHSGGGQIPQNILLKVLSSTLLLLEKVHEKGVIWNDVKTDHIFWQEDKKVMNFIDWGNGLFLQPQPDPETSPIWQDYQQLMEEGTNLLTQTSPAMIHDLGWPATSTGMSLQDIKQLQLRVDYLEMYMTMRAIEYQLLFKRFSANFTDTDALRQTLDLQKELRSFGIQVDSAEVFASAQPLLLDSIEEGMERSIKEILQVFEEFIGPEIPDNWRLAAYLLQGNLGLSQDAQRTLSEFVLNSDWVEAVWLARKSIQEGTDANVLGSAIYSMRSLYLNSQASHSVYTEILSFAKTLSEQTSILTAYDDPASVQLRTEIDDLNRSLRNLADNWAQLMPGEALGEKFLKLKQILTAASTLKLKIPHQLNDQLQRSMVLIREIYQSWNSADLTSAIKSVKKLYITEPSLDYLLPMHDDLLEMRAKIDQFMEGPPQSQTITEFAQEFHDYQSPLTRQINQTNWQTSYNHVLDVMTRSESLEQLQDTSRNQNWPVEWLYHTSAKLRPASSKPESKLSETQLQQLAHFHQQLKTSEPAQLSLVGIKNQLPSWHANYKQLAEEFLFSFSNVPREPFPLTEADFPQQDRENISNTLRTLEKAARWKTIASSGDWYLLKMSIDTTPSGWRVLDDLGDATIRWNAEILPSLTELKQRNWSTARFKQILQPRFPELSQAQSYLFSFHSLWQKIEYQGLFPELLNDLSYHIDRAQASFFEFWQKVQKDNSAALVWLVNQQQSVFSEINQTLLTLMRSLRAMQRNFDVVNQTSMARTRLAQNSAGDLVFTLTKIDELLRPAQKDSSVFRRWQRQYLDLLAKPDRTSIRKGIQEIESIHPLLPWFDELVKRDAGYFDQPDAQQW